MEPEIQILIDLHNKCKEYLDTKNFEGLNEFLQQYKNSEFFICPGAAVTIKNKIFGLFSKKVQ